MNLKHTISFGVFTAIVLASLIAINISNQDNNPVQEPQDSNLENVSSPVSGTQEEPQETVGRGKYLDYSESSLADAGDSRVLIFFHADWCPTCQALDRDIRNNSDDIPAGLTILKTDFGYSGETELAERYGVTYQHTLIEVNEKGEELERWPYGSFLRLEEIVEELGI